MSIDQEPNITNSSTPEPMLEPVDSSSLPTSAERFETVYPKPVEGQAEPVIRPDVDEDSLGYN